jgi:signal transduction histidine kinase
VTLSLDAPKRLPPVAADEQQLRQVLQNLVDNAIKCSSDGGPVAVKLARSPRAVRWTVSDEGLGIPASERRRIFEKFYRLDPNMTRGIGGTGLGLYICRELVHRLDGRIWVESNNGRGSTFIVEIPTAKAPAPRRVRTAA